MSHVADPGTAIASVVKIADIELDAHKYGEYYEARLGAIARPRGAKRLGCRVTVVPSGKRAWPFHCHHANDELFVVIKGSGTLRFGQAEYPISEGDVVVCPAGGAETAHQIVNTSGAELTYLAVSSMHEPDVMEYPDSGKFGVFAGSPPGGSPHERTFAVFAPTSSAVDYWDGEPDLS